MFYSDQNAKNKNLGWIRMGHNIHYYKNNVRRKDCKGERYVAVRERGELDFETFCVYDHIPEEIAFFP